MEVRLRGIGVSPGIAIAPAVTYHVKTLEVPRYTITDPVAELARYDHAVDRSRGSLEKLREQVAEELGPQHARIFDVHLELLDDPALRPEIERRLNDEKLNAEYLVDDLITGYQKIMSQVDDPLFRERSSDLLDVGRRILGNLLQEEIVTLERLDQPSVVVAYDLSPSETVNMDMTNTRAIATDAGGPTSHMSILARAFEIPCVVALNQVGTQVRAGDPMIVDGSAGVVVLRPTEQTLERYRTEQTREAERRQKLVAAEVTGPAVTLDGVEIPTLANIELLAETEHSLRAHCQGVGLYRTEYLFMNQSHMPTEDEQYENYRSVLERMAPLPVTIRTLDLGGDKIVPELYREVETNPQLGWRSIRLCLDRPDIFKAQLRALFRASVHGNMQIMFPMISGVDQLREAMRAVVQVKADLKARGVEFNPDVPVGSMIEVPAAVTNAAALARECDFCSIGSNDLIQYALAVDRVNRRTADLYNPSHPGVLSLLKIVIDAAKKAEIPCTICGEMAGDPMLTELLLGLGIESLSMSAVSLPQVRAEIARTKIITARRLANRILRMGSEADIRALLQRRFEKRSNAAAAAAK
mgnify:CR=1 FL=1